MTQAPNKITGPNAGGPRQFPIRTPLAARVGQFWRSAEKKTMSSWIKCPCGEYLHKNLFAGAGVRVVVSDTILDQIPEEATAAGCVSNIIARGEILVICTGCGRIAIEDRHGVISIYSKES